MKFDVITIFPRLFEPFQEESLIKRALAKRLFSLDVHNLRDYARDKHRSAAEGEPRRGRVDDKPFGGGLGMVMKIEPWYRAIQKLKKKGKSKVILFTPRGKKFTQNMAHAWSKFDQLVFVCGRYEGIDERVASHLADEEVSIGDFVLMGGEIPAMAVIESVARLIPGVVGKPSFLQERLPEKKGRGGKGFLEYPEYTRPEIFRARLAKGGKAVQWKVPSVLLSGDHKKIQEWKKSKGKVIGRKQAALLSRAI